MTPWTDDPVARARAPRVPSSHLRPGRVPEPRSQCQYAACTETATATIVTRTVRKDYCPGHHALVLGDLQARTPRRIPELQDGKQ